MLDELEHTLALNNAKYRFMLEIMEDKINIYRKKKVQIIQILDGSAEVGAAEPAYPKYPAQAKTEDDDSESPVSYEYLLSMRIDSFSYEKLQKIQEKIENLEKAIAELKGKSIKQLWTEDLDEFLKLYDEELVRWRNKNKIEELPKRKQIKISNSSKISKNSGDDDNMSVMSVLEKPDDDLSSEVVKRKKKLMLKTKPKAVITKKI